MNQRIAPESLWEPFRVGVDGDWDERRARHLARRAAIGVNDDTISRWLQQGLEATVDELLRGSEESAEQRAEREALARTLLGSGQVERLGAWWVHTATHTVHPLRERMTIFWHGHFATGGDKVTDAEAHWRQNQLLRQEALGNFRRMTQAIARDPAMLLYLDSATNRKAHPNENFARELMELFCLGEGHYSERDVQELARCFTGWEVRQGRFRFNRYQHDNGLKLLFGEQGEFPDGESIDRVIDHPRTGLFLAGKLYRLFVADETPIDDAMLEPVARRLREENWEIAPAVRMMLLSRMFLGEEAIGKKIRSPVDLMIGLLRTWNGTCDFGAVATSLLEMGMGLFFPPSVKGWDGGRTWINASTLLARANGVGRWIDDPKTRLDGRGVGEVISRAGREVSEELAELERRWLAVPLSSAFRERLLQKLVGIDDAPTRGRQLLHAVASSPVGQLG